LLLHLTISAISVAVTAALAAHCHGRLSPLPMQVPLVRDRAHAGQQRRPRKTFQQTSSAYRSTGV